MENSREPEKNDSGSSSHGNRLTAMVGIGALLAVLLGMVNLLRLHGKDEGGETKDKQGKVSVPSFGGDLTDGKKPGEWESRYPDDVRELVRGEAIYLLVLLFVCPLLLFAAWVAREKNTLGLSENSNRVIWTYLTAWISGTLAGTLFDLKWLYHSVARGLWHKDRRCWRWFTPHISGGLSFVMLALVSSGLLNVFDATALKSGAAIVGFCFIVGYFSDTAIGKLSELANTLFGTKKSDTKAIPPSDAPGNKDK